MIKLGERILLLIQNWSEIEKRYASLKPTSRSPKNLKEWGIVLGSAYTLNPAKADEMWQYVIDLNISSDIAFSKYFVAQIFNKLICTIEPDKAVEFLLLRPARLPLLLLHGFGGAGEHECVFHIFNYYLLRKKYNDIISFLTFLNQKHPEEHCAGFWDNCYVCTFVEASMNSVLPSYDEYALESDNERTLLYKLAIGLFGEFCENQYDNSVLTAVVIALRSLYLNKVLKDEHKARKTLELLLYKGITIPLFNRPNLFADFLFLERDIVDNNTIDQLLEKCCENHLFLPVDTDEDDTTLKKEKVDWFCNQILNSSTLIKYTFSKPIGMVSEFEIEHLDSLAKNGQWEEYIDLICIGLNSGDVVRKGGFLSYLRTSIAACKIQENKETSICVFGVEIGSIQHIHKYDDPYHKFTDAERRACISAFEQICSLATGVEECERLLTQVKSLSVEITGSPELHNADELLKIKPTHDVLNRQILKIMDDVDEYTAEKRPRGFNSRCQDVIMSIKNSVAILSKENQVDVLASILRKLCNAREHLLGFQFATHWMDFVTDIPGEQLESLYNSTIDVFDTWLNEKPDRNYIKRVAHHFGRTGNYILFQRFKNQVFQHTGLVEDLGGLLYDSHRSASVPNKETQEMVNAIFDALKDIQ